MGQRAATVLVATLGLLLLAGAAGFCQLVTGPTQLERCDEGLFTITFENPSPTQTACQIVAKNTPPSSEFVYVPGSGSVTVPGYGTYSANPVLGSWNIDSIVGSAVELPVGQTITVQFRLATTCLAISGTESVEVEYVDCSAPGAPLAETDSLSIEILPGAVTVEKTPANPPGGVGDVVTWTLKVKSTGLGSIKNVVATDTLGSGLEYVSSSPAGTPAGQTITWDSSNTPGLADMDADSVVSIQLSARVVACTGLENTLDAQYGCGGGQVCGDTATHLGECGSWTATSSVAFIARLPFLSFSAPTITIPYCAATTSVSIPIMNSGDGTAHDGVLCADLGPLAVSNVGEGASYVGGCFHLPDIAAGATYTLTFNVTYADSWCMSRPSGTPLYTLDYKNDCGVTHHATPKFGSISTSAAPGLSVSKTGPSVVQYGSQVTYNVAATYSGPKSCGSGDAGQVTVIDHLPNGFAVVASAGGAWVPGAGGTGGTVTWTFNPNVSESTGWSLVVQVPLECGYCYTEQTNTVDATAVSCCGCGLSASSSTTMAIECARLYTSNLTFSPTSTLERCGDAVTFTDSHTFADDAGLDGVSFSDFVYSFIKQNGLAYVPGSGAATIDGAPTTVSITDGVNALQLTASDARSVRNHTLVFTYDMKATSASLPACGGSSSFYVWASHSIPEVGPCTLFYDTALLTIQPPSMSVAISGVPTIQEDCATYSVTLTFRRTSALASPYDARLVLTGTSAVIADFAGTTWAGVAPSEAPIVGADSIEWRFADGFASAPGAAATLTVPVTIRCGGSLLPPDELVATGSFDDLCHNDGAYDTTCSTAASASSSLHLTGDVHISKTPEVIYTTSRSVTWTIELYNASNGTAYNVYVDDVLGTGLVYSSSSVSGLSGTMATTVNQDHNGVAMNGASFLISHIDLGERPKITLTANLVACSNMTNVATVGWGCGGSECQSTRSDSSYVITAPANVVSTSIASTPVDACTTQKATITFRSAGIATAYDLSATATLPNGLVYVGNPEYRVSGGSWLAAGAPSGAPGLTLTWDQAQVVALAAVNAGVTIDIRFDVQPSCSFSGGTLQARTSYENPCGQTFLSSVGAFSIASRTPTLSLAVSQTSPASGQPIACGSNATWEIRVTNNGPAAAAGVWVEDTLGTGLVYVSSTGGADGGTGAGQSATWEILNLGAGSTAVLTVTAQATSCGTLTNAVKAYWACGPDGSSATTPDCLSSSYASGSAAGTRVVTVSTSASLSPSSIGACESGNAFTLTLTNTSASAPAYSVDARVTLPSGLSYRAGSTEINCGTGFSAASDPVVAGQVLTWYSTALTGSGNDMCSTIPAGGSIAVRFQVDAACYRTTASATIDTYYYDCCGATQYHGTSTSALTAAPPTLSVSMTPSTAALDCANPSSTVTWTITVQNTGQSTAGFIRIIDTLGADLVHVSGGTQIGGNPQQWGWEFGPLAPTGSQSVQLVVRLGVPPDDCSASRRTNTAVTSWGCTLSALDGDPNTTTEYACTSSGGSVTRTATVLVPDLSISSSDLAPQFTCSGDGISNGRMLLTVRNAGTAAISTDFSLTFSESTTGWSGGGSFTSLGGALPLAAGGSQTLTLSNWPIACSSCSYTFTASLDTGGAVCECRENNNTATLSYVPTSPDLAVAASTLTPACAGDGQVRIQGNVTLRNQGCGSSAFTTSVPMRFTVYAGPSCSGTVLDQWTQTFASVSLAAGGGTQAFAVDRTSTYNACSPCQISILIEADYSNAICECSGTNNTLCAGPLSIAFPDLIVSGIDFGGLTCASDAIAGSVVVTVTNQGCGAAGAFSVGLSTSGCLTFSPQRVTSLGAGASVGVTFPAASTWGGCGTCACTFTASVDTGSEVCECNGGNNTGTGTYTSPLPDLVITALAASAATPCSPGSAQVTVRNSGCGVAPAGVVVSLSGAVTGQALTTIPLTAGESQTVTVPFAAAIGCGTGDSVTATVDPANAVCECTGANNTASTTFSVSAPDLTVTGLAASCNLDDTFSVTASIQNVGGQAANSVLIRAYGDGMLIHSETQTIAAGASYALSYATPPLLCATPHTIRVVADETNAICECSEANNEASISSALCSCPALSTSKSITNVWRGGTSIWPTSSVEPGDILEYTATIINNGAAIAFHVDLTDTLPSGLAYTNAAPGHGGQYTLSSGGSGMFSVQAGGTSFRTSLSATLTSGQSMTIRYCATAQSSVGQGAILTNVIAGYGEEGNEDSIPAGSASVTTSGRRPGFAIEKVVTNVLRNGIPRGALGLVEPGDVVAYQCTVRNVGGGTAYEVELHDALPAGLVYESAGIYTVSSPSAAGSLGATPGATSFQTSLHATLAGGATLTASYSARATSGISGATPLLNTVSVAGRDGAGGPVPSQETSIPDTFPDVATASIASARPALAVDKAVVDVRRGGASVGIVDPLVYGDIPIYRITVRNVGLGTAYGVDAVDALPAGIVIDTSTELGAGTYSVTAPSGAGELHLTDGATGFTTALHLTMTGGGAVVLEFAARVTASASPSVSLPNVATATGSDGTGGAIPEFDITAGDSYADTDTASVRVGAPALVTEKSIARIVRNGQEVPADHVEIGDVVTYELAVRNVGHAPASVVSIRDILPSGLTYHGRTSASWPGGTSTASPQELPGQTLAWSLPLTLGSGEALFLTLEAVASGPIRQGATYTNVFAAVGVDMGGKLIAPDSHVEVPGDTDLDDSSSIAVVGGQPALVTQKQIVDVIRDGRSLGPSRSIAAGDVVVFDLIVTNVGAGTAYDIQVRDDLPAPFAYVPGTTVGSWASVSSAFQLEPSGAPGPALVWPTATNLVPGDSLTLRYQARVSGALSAVETYWNAFSASGVDAVGGAIPAEVDLDDQAAVALTAAPEMPALVTGKAIASLRRGGVLVRDGQVEVGDVVEYALVVQNVGPRTAYAVEVVDELPHEFEYVLGSSAIESPRGFSVLDPRLSPQALTFDAPSPLGRGEEMAIRFQARVVGPLVDGRLYVNRMTAVGTDSSGAPIPTNQSLVVPADIDDDDASTASIRARSWLAEGGFGGGLVSVPVLRKTAETFAGGGCRGTAAVVDRVWFQTDIAMFAASEFATYAAEGTAADLFPDTLLPTWARTVRAELDRYALENTLQVEVLTGLGVSLTQSPRVVATADAWHVTADEAAAQRLAELRRLAGVTADDAVPEGRWVVLEGKAGEPVFQAERDTAWGEAGAWTVADDDVVASSLGMGLVREAQLTREFLVSADARERYVGWVLAEAMAGKLEAIDRDLTVDLESAPDYVPHVARFLDAPGAYEVVDGASVLFDQLSLLWGAARTLKLVEERRADWPSSEQDLLAALDGGARTLLARASASIATYHIAVDGRIVGRSPATNGVWTDASTVDVGLLLLAIDEALPVGGDATETLRGIQARALSLLTSRQRLDGSFAEVTSTAGVSTDLTAQFAAMYALLMIGNLPAAERTFDFLESQAWDDWRGFGLYRMPGEVDATTCYTALDLGLAIGALRELSLRSGPNRSPLAASRLASFARTVLDDAALQLDNAEDGSSPSIAAGDGRGDVFALRVEDADRLAPVLQQSLCLEQQDSDVTCGEWRVPSDEPWYQTDIAMYASAVLRGSTLEREDDADANLVAVDFHSTLGVPFEAYSALAGQTAQTALDLGATAALEPIVLPFYSGDPYAGGEGTSSLAWSSSSFDERIVPSALGMTLLREAQAVRELARQSARTPEDELVARTFLRSIVGKVDALEGMVTPGPLDVPYIPHAFEAVWTGNGVDVEATDLTSTLFDQASLLLGLVEAAALARDAAASDLFAALSADPVSVASRAEALLGVVIRTLEAAHFRAGERVLADASAPQDSAWLPGDEASTWSLGLVVKALDAASKALGEEAESSTRARRLLDAEVAFLRSTLWDGSGGYRETWTFGAPKSDTACESPTLVGQLGALRALLVAERDSGSGADEIRAAVLSFDARFWDPAEELYVSRLDRLAWCMTPLDVAYAVDVLPEATRFVEAADAALLRSHLVRHVDRALDALDLQIPARSLAPDGQERRFAPVFDRRVCLERVAPYGGLSWTQAGDLVRYTIEVENPTEETFTRLTLDDVLPESVTPLATNPEATVDGRSLRWTFDRLAPGEARTWQIDVRVARGAEGDALTNCATLKYTDAMGVERPTREACASVTPGDADAARAAELRGTSVSYRTDEAMRLAVALDSLLDQDALGTATGDAGEASIANLGVLLGESGLGVPFELSPLWNAPGDAAASLAALAARAGLPGVPRLALPIFLPSVGGVPVLERGTGFLTKNVDVSPASIGWTLAREADYLDASASTEQGLSAYLAGVVALDVSAQISWLNQVDESRGGGTRYVHSMAPEVAAGAVSYSVADPRSLAYDQASLLIGLVAASSSRGVDAESVRLAEDLAAAVLSDLARHVTAEGVLLDSLDVGSSPATWASEVVAVRALSEAAARMPRLARQARDLLARLAARAEGAPLADSREEAARVDVLLLAGRCLADERLRDAGVAAWKAFAETSLDLQGRTAFSAAARIGWRYAPAELALAFELLGDVREANPELGVGAEALATDLVRRDVLAEGVQLWLPTGYWREHVGLPCLDAAPVFAVRPGPPRDEPIWTLRRP